MLDPTGDIPWDEEPDAGDVVHIVNEQVSASLGYCTSISFHKKLGLCLAHST